MKYLLLTLVFAGLLACSGSSQPGSSQAGASQGHSTTIQFSTRPSTMSMNDPANWCAAQFGEAALISADPQHFYHRKFALSDIPCKVVVDLGHQSAAFMLAKVGDHVELLTSDNLPACLSNKANFQLSPEGTSFRYDNHREVVFDAYLQELPNGLQVEIDLPDNGGHGISAARCVTCK